MTLTQIFSASICHSDDLLKLYNALLSRSYRAAKSNWVDRVYEQNLIRWARKDGLWRSHGADLLIIGNNKCQIKQSSFQQDFLTVILRSSLMFAMSAVDKILHEAVSKNFMKLVKSEEIDRLTSIPISQSYSIAIESRKRKGKGGKVKARPGHMLKEHVLQEIYKHSFLGNRRVEEICSMCEKKKVFSLFANHINDGSTADQISKRWASLYIKRNHIVHECDMVRKEKAKRIDFNKVNTKKVIEDIGFVKKFGLFLAAELN